MTKKEQEMVEQLRTRLALRFTDDVLPDVAPPHPMTPRGLSKGWAHVGALSDYHARVEIACSSSTGHAIGQDDHTTSQQSMWLFSSELRALRAMRNEVERHAAKRLRQIDKMIDSAAMREVAGGNQGAKGHAVTPSASAAPERDSQ